MSKPKLGPVMPGHVKPVHIGVYEVLPVFAKQRFFAKWNGKHWCYSSQDLYSAERQGGKSWHQSRDWRGLAEKPDA